MDQMVSRASSQTAPIKSYRRWFFILTGCTLALILAAGSAIAFHWTTTPLILAGSSAAILLILLWIIHFLLQSWRYHTALQTFYQSRIDALHFLKDDDTLPVEKAAILFNAGQVKFGRINEASADLLEMYRISEGPEQICCCCGCGCRDDHDKKKVLSSG